MYVFITSRRDVSGVETYKMQGLSDDSQPTQAREDRDESLLDLISSYGHQAAEKSQAKAAPASAEASGKGKDGKK
jgi:hypothetical protein